MRAAREILAPSGRLRRAAAAGCLVLLAALALPGLARADSAASAEDAETQALVQRLVLDRAATLAAVQQAADERERRLLAELGEKDRRLRAEIGRGKTTQAKLDRVNADLRKVTAERLELIAVIAAKDRQLAAEIAEYRKQVASIANSPDPRKREALARYAEGDREGAFDALVEIQEAEIKAVAAGLREITALAADRKDRGEMSTTEVIPFYEKAQRLDPAHSWNWILLRRLYHEAGLLPEATNAAQQALKHAQDDSERMVVAAELGDLQLASGDLPGANALYQESLTIARRLAQAKPTSAAAQNDLSVSLSKVGNAEMSAGNLSGAKAHYEESWAIARHLAQSNPTNAGAQLSLGISLEHLGDIELAVGDLASAKVRFEERLTIARHVAQANPASSVAQRAVSVGLGRLGEVEVAAGNLANAKVHFKESLAIARRLIQIDSTSAAAQSDLGISLVRLGDAEVLSGDLSRAKECFEESLAIVNSLARSNPASAADQRDLGVILERLGSSCPIIADHRTLPPT